MAQPKSILNHHFSDILNKNPNTPVYKSIISETCKKVQQRTYWYFTENDAEFLGYVYNHKTDGQILKNRIRQITDQKLSEVIDQIMDKKLKKNQQQNDELQIKLDIKDIYQSLPLNEQVKPDRGKEKIKAINQDFKRFKEKINQIKYHHQIRKAQKKALQQQFKKSLENQQKEQQRKQIQRKLQSLKQNEQQRKKSNEKFRQFLKQFKKTKPLHVLMEEEYKQKIQLPKIQESRKKLQMLTHRKKPTLQQINNHDKLYMINKANRPQKIVQSQTIDVSFKSHFYQLQEQRQRQRQQMEQNGPQWDFLQKQKRYSQFVKDKIKPKVSKKLRQSLEKNLSKNYVQYQAPDRSKVIQVGKNYLEYMRSLQKNRRSSTPAQPIQLLKQSRYINYLDQLKTRSEHSHTTLDWEKDLRDRGTSKLQKRERILMKSKQLQQKAMRDEKFVSNYNFGKPEQIIQKKRQIDQTLLSSIKAKVAILKNAHQP